VNTNNWQPLTPHTQNLIPQELHSWLIDTGSLTAKLRNLCNSFSVHLLQQRERKAFPHESTLLELADNKQLIDREVQLYCDEIPVVYARSLIPVRAISDRFKDLDNMGERPLGEKIFSDPQLNRSPIEWCAMNSENPNFGNACRNVTRTPARLYGRRSLFYGAAKPIMISEFFLPGIMDICS